MEDKLLNSSESKLVLIITLIIVLITILSNLTFAVICNTLILLIYMYNANNRIYKTISDELKSKFNLKIFKLFFWVSFLLFISMRMMYVTL